MEQNASLSTGEIVGIAAASAAALGGVIVALGRSQAAAAREKAQARDAAMLSLLSRDTVEHNVERGRELARSAAAQLVATYPELRVNAAELLHRAADTARPRASQVGSRAAVTAGHARETGTSVIGRIQEDVIPRIQEEVIPRIQEDVIPAASTAISGLVERASEVRERSTPAAGDVKSVAARKADAALAKSTSAAKETLATLVWSAIAATIVYLVLLSPERREQIKSFLWGVVDQTVALVQDFQGEESEF